MEGACLRVVGKEDRHSMDRSLDSPCLKCLTETTMSSRETKRASYRSIMAACAGHLFVGALTLVGSPAAAADPAWLQYGGTAAKTYYQPLETKLRADNIADLKRRWIYEPASGSFDLGYPLYADGRIGICDGSVFQLVDPATGVALTGHTDVGYQCLYGALSPKGLYAESTYANRGKSSVRALGRGAQQRWRAKSDDDSTGFNAPALAGNTVYVTDKATGVYAYRASDGSLLWHQQTMANGTNPRPPVVGGGKVIVTRAANWDTYTTPSVYAYHAATGGLAWSLRPDQVDIDGHSNIAIAAGLAIASSLDVFALDLETGQVRWSVDGTHGAQLSVVGDRVYAVGLCNAQALDLHTGAVLWRLPRACLSGAGPASNLVVANGLIFYTVMRYLSPRFSLEVRNAATGELIALKQPIEVPTNLTQFTQIAVVDGMVLIRGDYNLQAFALD